MRRGGEHGVGMSNLLRNSLAFGHEYIYTFMTIFIQTAQSLALFQTTGSEAVSNRLFLNPIGTALMVAVAQICI